MAVDMDKPRRAARLAPQRWILSVLGRRMWLVVALVAVQALVALNAVVFALLMRSAINGAVDGNADEFWRAGVAFALLCAVQVALRAAARFLNEYALVRAENACREAALAGLLARRYRDAAAFHTADVMSRLTSDATVVATGVVGLLPSWVSMGVRVVAALSVMYALMPGLALTLVAFGVVLALASACLRGLMRRLHKQMQEAESGMRVFVQECLESLLVVRAFGCEKKVESEAADHMAGYRAARMRRANASNFCTTGLNAVMRGGYALGFLWCGWGILQGTVSYGTLMACVQLVGQIESPFASAGSTFSRYLAMLASAERLMELADGGARGEVRSEAQDEAQAEAKGAETAGEAAIAPSGALAGAAATSEPSQGLGAFESVRMENVTFSYTDAPVLQDCSLEVRAGEALALAGPSGTGKSTLVKLMLGALTPSSGRVVLVRAGQERELRDLAPGLFAYVPQGNCLMSGTIREVVSFAERGACVDEARVREACRAACADGFVEALPEGLDTQLGERGAGLSEGQMQRLAVARAVYSEAPVLLLDEATSALDTETERSMLERLRALPGRTIVIITHRPQVLELCDRVVHLEGGSCVAV